MINNAINQIISQAVSITENDQMNSHQNDDHTHTNSLTQLAIATIGTVGLTYGIYNFCTNQNGTNLINRIYTHLVGIPKTLYQSYQHNLLSFHLNLKVPLFIEFLNEYKKMQVEKGLDIHTDILETPKDNAFSYAKIRQCTINFEPAAKRIIHEVFTKYISPKPILELGSNLLNDEGKSYLERILPTEFQSGFIKSDFNVTTVESEKAKSKGPYLLVDATRLSEQLPCASVANIAAINVFDTISRAKLSDVVKELDNVLESNGKLAILCDLPFEQNPLFDKYSSVDSVVFPYEEKGNFGIKIISKEILLEHGKYYGETFIQFLKFLFELSPKHCSNFLLLTMGTHCNLCELLGKICPEDKYQKIDHKQSYINDMTNAFQSHGGFDIVKNDYVAASVTLKPTNEQILPINFMLSDLRTSQFIINGIHPHFVKTEMVITTVFHVLVASKK